MKKALRNSVTAIWMGWIGLGIIAKANEPDAKPNFFVCVHNYARVPSNTMNDAEKVAKRIFEQAGVETTWMDFVPSSADALAGKTPCASTLPRMYVNLVDHYPSYSLAGNVLGLAPGTDEDGERQNVYVFEQVADKMVQQQQIAVRSDILGHAMAHEIGHVLAHVTKHSPTGLMKANWQREDFRAMVMCSLNFNSEQASRIREEVSRRTREHALLQLAANSQEITAEKGSRGQ